MALRAQQLSAATQDQWRNIYDESDKQLLAVLTPAQLAYWPKIFTERTIRINFRMQSWTQVLQWFAEQLGMQLVMDAPPPGTFNYADNRDYTPSEAIDLLNSVLQTKGYTLVRNDRMLMLFNLNRGPIPVQFLPKLKPEDLTQRGTFEYTTVIFPLERRVRADVIQTIQPFKGSFCKIVPMPGNSLMITDTAGTLLVLQKVIESIENPPIPAPVVPPAATPGVWRTYAIEKNDPGKIEEIFKEFAPTAKTLRIGSSNKLHVLLPQAEQSQLETILQLLETDIGTAQSDLVLASYSIAPYLNSPQQLWQLNRMRRGMMAPQMTPGVPFNPYDTSVTIGKEIIEILKKTFPSAVVSEAAVANNVVVLATKTEQEKIAKFFEELKQTPAPEDEMTAKLYKFADAAKKMNDETLKQLRAVVPTGTFTLDEEQGQILVVATAKEQELLAGAVKELEVAAMPEADKIIVSYRMPASTATRFSSMLTQMVSRKELAGILQLRDPKQGYVTVWATAKQHELIQKLYEEVTGRKKPGDPKAAKSVEPVLATYPMLRGYAYTAHLVLSNMIAGADFSYDPRTNAVIAVAPPELQQVIEKAVEELDKGISEDIAFIALKKELPADIMRQIARIAPRSVVIQSRRNLQVIATGPKIELDKVKAILTASEAAAATKEEVVVHQLQTAAPSTVTAVLADVFPEVKVTVNAVNNQLVLTMSSEVKEPVQSLLTQLDGSLEFVPVKRAPSAQLLQSIRTVAPRATVIVDTENSQVMLQGAVADVEKVKKIIVQSEAAKPIEEEVYVHTFRQVYTYYVTPILNILYPEVKVAGYPSYNQLAVRIPPELKEKVMKLFEEVDGDIAFIPLKAPLQPETLTLCRTVSPYATMIPDPKNLQLMVYGTKPDVEKIKKVIAASEAAAPSDEEVYVHTFRQVYSYQVAPILQAIYPEVRVASYPTYSQMAVRVRPDMKEKVVKLFEEMDGDIAFIPLKKELSPEMTSMFQRVAPYAVVIEDKRNSLALVYGTKPDVDKIQKLITTSETVAAVPEEVLVHNLKHVESTTVTAILREIHPDIKIKDDVENGRLVIRMRPDQKEAITSLLAQLDAADPDKEKRFFKSYPLDTGFYSMKAGYSRYRPVEFIGDLQKLVPRAKLSFDENSQQLIVWGTEDEHRAIDAAVGNLSDDGKAKKYGRFPLRRIPSYILIPVINRMYPTVLPTYDLYGNSVIVEGHPRLLEKIGELIATLDPAETSPNDPTVRFYTLNAEPTPVLVQSLQRLVPTAYVVPDKEAKQVMVIAKPAEQQIIEKNVQAIVATFTAPEEPMLFIYPATPDQRERLEAFVRTAARDLKGVAIVPDKSPNQVSVWAKPSEHQLIAEILKQMEANKANEPDRKLQVFHMSIGDLVTAQEIMKVSHPDASVFSDRQGNRLLVWATVEELEKVKQTLDTQGSLDSRTMVAYPVAGPKPETLVKVITDVFKGLRITPEPQTRRILVWASPEEHVKVAEIVEQANRKEDPESALAEKFVAYSSAGLDARTITPLFKALIPDADVYADPTTEKITVRARSREHEQIKDLFEQLRLKDEKLRPVLAVYPIGDTDPIMLEAMLRAQLQNAESMSSDEIVEQLGWSYYYERMPWYRSYNRQTVKKTGYFKVDPQTQAVYVFVNGDDQQDVAKAIEQLVAVGNREGVKPTVRRYSLEEMSFYDIYSLLYKIVPSGNFQPIYNYTPSAGRSSFYASYRDFLAYTRESEHEKIDALVREMNDRAGSGKKEMLSITIPEGSKFGRDKVIETIQKLYPDIAPMPGGASNQILVWSTGQRLEKIRKMVDEACKPLPENQQTIVKSYSLQYISVEDAQKWLAAIVPNASFDPTPTGPGAIRRPPAPRRPTDPKILYVIATPLEHLEIDKAIKELDRDMPVTQKLVPRSYALDEHPTTTFMPLYRSVIQAFPNAVVTTGAEQQSLLVVATEDDHRQITAFLTAYKEDRESKRYTLEVYGLKKLNYYKVYPLIRQIAPPPAQILAASKPEQIGIWATPRIHADIANALTKLETAATEVDHQNLRVYKVGGKKAYTANSILTWQFPGALIFPISYDEIIAWASAVDHEAIAKILGSVAESFPEPVLKTYYFKYVPIGEASLLLNRMYTGQATISPRQSTGDLLVHATPDIQAKIAANIAEFDVPRPADTESIPVAYDLSELPLYQVNSVAVLVRQAFPGLAIVLPSSVPGQIVVLAKTAEQEKIRSMVDQMISERPETAGRMEAYTIHRGTVAGLRQTLLTVVPHIRYGYGLNPNQLLVWAKDADHAKIKNIVDKLNEPDTEMKTEVYSLRNVYSTGVMAQIRNLTQTLGLDIKTPSFDYYTNQLIVTAREEDQKLVAELIEKLRAKERDMQPFVLETVDPVTAYYAVNTLFADEPYFTSPEVYPDQNTNMIFVQGTPEQIQRIRKMLIDMGETQLRQLPSEGTSDEPAPGTAAQPAVARSTIRSITIRGDAADTIRELEKLWPQYKRNQLRVIRQDEPLIQQKEEPKPAAPGTSSRSQGYYSLSEEVERSAAEPEAPSPARNDETHNVDNEPGTVSPDLTREQVREKVNELFQKENDPVYIIVNEDGSLTVTSYDANALDQLERLVKRIDDRVVFEGRDFTIYSVRNVSAALVAMRIRLVLRDKLAGRQQRLPGTANRFQTSRLEIQEDVANSTITVRGPKAERTEVANLIAMFDVSELPGGSKALKPIKVPIKNVQAARVLQQVLNVYQQRIMSIQLPGGGYPRVTVDNVTNSIELIVPEPLATELKEYAMEIDRMILEEPSRRIHVIPLEIKSSVISNTIQRIQTSSGGSTGYNPYLPGRR